MRFKTMTLFGNTMVNYRLYANFNFFYQINNKGNCYSVLVEYRAIVKSVERWLSV